MSANPNMKVAKLQFYYADKEEKTPRVSMTVEGCYEFIFTCNNALRPIRVPSPNHCHDQIKRTAHAHAAIVFKKHMTPRIRLTKHRSHCSRAGST